MCFVPWKGDACDVPCQTTFNAWNTVLFLLLALAVPAGSYVLYQNRQSKILIRTSIAASLLSAIALTILMVLCKW